MQVGGSRYVDWQFFGQLIRSCRNHNNQTFETFCTFCHKLMLTYQNRRNGVLIWLVFVFLWLQSREEEGGLYLAWDERKKGGGARCSDLETNSRHHYQQHRTPMQSAQQRNQNSIFQLSAHQQRRLVVLKLDFYRASPFCPGSFILHSCSSDVAFMGGEGAEGNFGKTSFGQFSFVCVVIG